MQFDAVFLILAAPILQKNLIKYVYKHRTRTIYLYK